MSTACQPDQISKALAVPHREALLALDRLAHRLAADEQVSAKEIAETCAATGTSEDELRAEVDRHHRVIAEQARLAAEPAAIKRRTEIEAERAALIAQHREERQRFEQAAAALDEETWTIQQAVSLAAGARTRLREQLLPAWAKAEIKSLTEPTSRLVDEMRRYEAQCEALRRPLEPDPKIMAGGGTRTDRERHVHLIAAKNTERAAQLQQVEQALEANRGKRERLVASRDELLDMYLAGLDAE